MSVNAASGLTGHSVVRQTSGLLGVAHHIVSGTRESYWDLEGLNGDEDGIYVIKILWTTGNYPIPAVCDIFLEMLPNKIAPANVADTHLWLFFQGRNITETGAPAYNDNEFRHIGFQLISAGSAHPTGAPPGRNRIEVSFPVRRIAGTYRSYRSIDHSSYYWYGRGHTTHRISRYGVVWKADDGANITSLRFRTVRTDSFPSPVVDALGIGTQIHVFKTGGVFE